MGYMGKGIKNLYQVPEMLDEFKEVYVLEKIHGTSAHVRHGPVALDGAGDRLNFFSGGVKHDPFVALFDRPALAAAFAAERARRGIADDATVVVYGEAYGGNCQAMQHVYGDRLRFVAFDVRVGERWLDVPDADEFVRRVGLEFVHYQSVRNVLANLDAARDGYSVQAARNGVNPASLDGEGIVIRPLQEAVNRRGERWIAKHKRASFCETKRPREVSREKTEALANARAIAEEWVTDERIRHVMDVSVASRDDSDKDRAWSVSDTPQVIRAVLSDIKKECGEEIVWSRDAERAVCQAAATAFKRMIGTLSPRS